MSIGNRVTHLGYRFGAFEPQLDLPHSARLTECCMCDAESRPMVQWYYCGTVGALCVGCLRQLVHQAIHGGDRAPGARA